MSVLTLCEGILETYTLYQEFREKSLLITYIVSHF